MADHALHVELFYDDVWNDHTTDMYDRDPVHIRRGVTDPGSDPEPAKATWTFRSAGTFNPRNPLSTLYGKIGQNTPVRFLLDVDPVLTDTFTRTVSSGFGTDPTFGVWWHAWSSGSQANFAVNGSQATHTVTSAGTWRMSWLQGLIVGDPDVTVTVTVPDPTGNNLEAGPVLMGAGTGDYLAARLTTATDHTMSLSLRMLVANFEVTLATGYPAFLHSASTPMKIRVRWCDGRIEAKVWQVGSSEPAAWLVTTDSTAITAPGWIGMRSGRHSSNTNANVVIPYDDLTVRAGWCRFVGEMAVWAPGRAIRGDDWTRCEAAGVLRRIGRGVDPLRSPLRRALLVEAPTAYWALDDGARSTTAASSVAGVPDLAGSAKFAAVEGPITSTGSYVELTDGSGNYLQPPLSAEVVGNVGSYSIDCMFRLGVNPGAPLPGATILSWKTSGSHGTVWNVDVRRDSGGGSYVSSMHFNPGATGGVGHTYDRSTSVDLWDGQWHTYRTEVNQATSSTLVVAQYIDGTWIGDNTCTGVDSVAAGRVTAMAPGLWGWDATVAYDATSVSVGEIVLWPTSNPGYSANDYRDAVDGHAGETAAARFLRLALEEGIVRAVFGSSSDSQPMGPQTSQTMLELLGEIERTDDGRVFEPRHFNGLAIRTGRSMVNATSTLTINYTGGGVAPDLEPVVGDEHIRNDVTAKNLYGGERRHTEDTGPRGTQPPPTGAGRYSTNIDVNTETDAALAHHAAWRVRKGTFDGTWYEQVTVDLDAAPELAPLAGIVDVGAALTMTNLPEDEILGGTVQHLVIGVDEVITQKRRMLTFNLEPSEPYTVAVTDTSGYLDCGGSTTNEALDTTETGVDVLITDACAWTHADGDYNILIGGEEMTVTAVSAVSGSIPSRTQTLTVTRSVNGVVKTHASGTEVHVSDPFYLAL